METKSEDKPASVETAGAERFVRFPKRAGEAQDRWKWVERTVWTKRMLERLAQSEGKTVWYSLWDKVWAEGNLNQATLEVVLNHGSAGVDGMSTEEFARQWSGQVPWLSQQLRSGQYCPQPVKRAWIEKPGSSDKRPLGVPVVRDRVVQGGLRHVLEPIFERDFAEQSYGFRPGRGCLDALRRVEELLMEGQVWVVDADLKSYFDTIPHERLLELISQRVVDGKILGLIEAFLKAGVMDGMKDWEPTERGTPQGGVISPLLANVYLNPLDHLMAGRGRQMVRYADDLVILCGSEAEAQGALAELEQWVKQAGLTLHPTKTRIVNAGQAGGFDFLGYHFERYQDGSGSKWCRKKSEQKLRSSLRNLTSRLRSGEMSEIIAELNPKLKGWYGYFRWSSPSALASVDGWVRRRLRCIQRWRWGRKGASRGRENVELPNRWFTEHGLFSLLSARVRGSNP